MPQYRDKQDRVYEIYKVYPFCVSGESSDGTRYKTAYACEGESLSIGCGDGGDSAVAVIRANYGRFSIAICNKHGHTDWSVNCMAPRTTRTLQNK